MAIDGVNSANKRMKMLVKELEVDGVAVGGVAPASAISDVTVTGTYATDDDAIETAINSILAALRTHGIVASS
jgi:hypothetical protein